MIKGLTLNFPLTSFLISRNNWNETLAYIW